MYIYIYIYNVYMQGIVLCAVLMPLLFATCACLLCILCADLCMCFVRCSGVVVS